MCSSRRDKGTVCAHSWGSAAEMWLLGSREMFPVGWCFYFHSFLYCTAVIEWVLITGDVKRSVCLILYVPFARTFEECWKLGTCTVNQKLVANLPCLNGARSKANDDFLQLKAPQVLFLLVERKYLCYPFYATSRYQVYGANMGKNTENKSKGSTDKQDLRALPKPFDDKVKRSLQY